VPSTGSKVPRTVPEAAARPQLVEDGPLARRFEEAGIETGDDTSITEWLDAAVSWATDGWGFDLPSLSGSAGLARLVMFLVVGLLAVVAVRWLLRQKTRRRAQVQAPDGVGTVSQDVDVEGVLEEALRRGDVDGLLAACWLTVELRLDRTDVVPHRPDRSAFELVQAVGRARPDFGARRTLRDLANTYVRLRYGPHPATLDEARSLAEAVRAFAHDLTVGAAA